MIRLIGLDLDGTLLTRNKKITERTAEALNRAADRGIGIVPVTGRPLAGLPLELDRIRGIRYAVTSNGACVYDLGRKTILRETGMEPEKAAEVLSAAKDFDPIAEIFAGGYGYHTPDTSRRLEKRFAGTPVMDYIRRSRRSMHSLEEFLDHFRGRIENISLMFSDLAERDLTSERLETVSGIRVIRPWPTDLEITHEAAEKGDALMRLAAILGIAAEDVMAMGDGDNDRSLLEQAGLSVAMGNAARHILEIADHVTGDNEHDGVASAVEKYVLQEG